MALGGVGTISRFKGEGERNGTREGEMTGRWILDDVDVDVDEGDAGNVEVAFESDVFKSFGKESSFRNCSSFCFSGNVLYLLLSITPAPYAC